MPDPRPTETTRFDSRPLATDGGQPTPDASSTAASGDAPSGTTPETDAADDGDGDESGRSVRRVLVYVGIGGLCLLSAIAVVQFYLSAGAAINQWIEPEFRAPFRAAFNLVVLLASLAGIYHLASRLERART
jgi:hypothetical protein